MATISHHHTRAAIALAVLLVCPVCRAGVIDFESLSDSDLVTTQFPGLVFSNAIAITAEISLNDLEFPPRSGMNVITPLAAAPISIQFLTPVTMAGAYFTYTAPVTLTAFDSADQPVASAVSAFTSNLLDDPGSVPNEFIEVSFSSGISSIVADAGAGTFTLDDLTYAPADSGLAAPEPGSLALLVAASAIWLLRRRWHSGWRVVGLIVGVVRWMGAAPTVPVPAAVPATIAAGAANTVTVTVAITDPTFLPGGATLLQVDANGKALAVLGVMHDDGLNGDVQANDGVLTLRVSLTPAAAGAIYLRVAAAFRGLPVRVQSGSSTVNCDLAAPDSWAGQWRVTLVYSDPSSGNVTNIYPTTDFIQTGEPLGLATAATLGTCSASLTELQLTVQCTGTGKVNTCSVSNAVQVAVSRNGDSLSGSATNHMTVSGACGPLTNQNQNIQISGTRLSANQGPAGSVTSMAISFVPLAGLFTTRP